MVEMKLRDVMMPCAECPHCILCARLVHPNTTRVMPTCERQREPESFCKSACHRLQFSPSLAITSD